MMFTFVWRRMFMTKKYYILTTEVRHNTYVVEATSEEEAEDLFISGDYEDDYKSEFQSEELHCIYCEDEVTNKRFYTGYTL
jgi:hypothetical protein